MLKLKSVVKRRKKTPRVECLSTRLKTPCKPCEPCKPGKTVRSFCSGTPGNSRCTLMLWAVSSAQPRAAQRSPPQPQSDRGHRRTMSCILHGRICRRAKRKTTIIAVSRRWAGSQYAQLPLLFSHLACLCDTNTSLHAVRTEGSFPIVDQYSCFPA